MRTLPILVLVLTASLAHADNWPRFRGPNGNGTATGKDIPSSFAEGKGILWKLPIPGKGNSSPVIWDNHLFLQSATPDGGERFLICIDLTKPEVLWQRSIPGSKAKTHDKNTLASATPVTDGKHVYAAFWDGSDVSLHAYTFKGDAVWSIPLGPFVSQHGAGASPVLYKDMLFFDNDMDKKSTLYCLDKNNGKILWKKDRLPFRACYCAPFLLEGQGGTAELVVCNSHNITGLEPETGKVLWNWKWDWSTVKKKDFPLRTIAAPLHVDGLLLACSGDGGGDRLMTAVALNGSGADAKPEKVWENKKDFPYVPNLLQSKGHVFFVNDGGFVGCYEPKKGKRMWFERADPDKLAFTASPVLIDDRIFAISEEGHVYVIAADSKEFRLIAKNALGEMVRSSPAVADGRLYIRGARHLFCIGKK